MKAYFKKLFYILTAFLLVVGMGASSVRAAGDDGTSIQKGSITIQNTNKGVTYTPYMIFSTDIKGNNDGVTKPSSYGYSIKFDGPWYSWLKSHNYLTETKPTSGEVNKNFFQIDVISNNERSLAYFTVDESNKVKFANDVFNFIIESQSEDKSLSPAVTGQKSTEDGAEITFNDLPLGYYIVCPTVDSEGRPGQVVVAGETGAIANLTTNAPDQTINPKSTKPTVDKTAEEVSGQKTFVKDEEGNLTEVNDNSVAVGNIEKFTLKGTVPNTVAYSNYIYKFEDTLTNMVLVIDKDHPVVLTVDDTEYPEKSTDNEGGIWEKTVTENKDKLSVTIDVTELQDFIGKDIIVTYFAQITSGAVTGEGTIKNSVVLQYGPDGNTGTDSDKVEFSNTELNVLKVDNANSVNKLANAKFTLQQDVANGKYFNSNEVSGICNMTGWSDTPVIFSTDNTGSLVFKGIEAGNYILKEVEAPAGFTLLANPIQITIDKDGNVSFGTGYTDTLVKILNKDGSDISNSETMDRNGKTVQVTNIVGTTLPETGGSGTTMLYVAGGILAAGAAIILITKKRMKA